MNIIDITASNVVVGSIKYGTRGVENNESTALIIGYYFYSVDNPAKTTENPYGKRLYGDLNGDYAIYTQKETVLGTTYVDDTIYKDLLKNYPTDSELSKHLLRMYNPLYVTPNPYK